MFAGSEIPLKAPQSIDKQRKTSNRNGLLVFSVLANDSNFDRNPLRGCNYGLEGGIFDFRGVQFFAKGRGAPS